MQFGKGCNMSVWTNNKGIVGETLSSGFDGPDDHCHFQFAGERFEPGQGFLLSSMADLPRVVNIEIGLIE